MIGKHSAFVLAALAVVGTSGALSQAVSFSGQLISFGSGLNYPQGIAVDASGNIFVADSGNNAVKEIVAVNGSIPAHPVINTLGGGFSNPGGVAVDASGNVFVADAGNGYVKEIVAVNGSIPATGAVIKTLFPNTFIAPSSVAVDSKGDVFVADIQLYEIPYTSGAYATPVVLGSTNSLGPVAVAVDVSGNVYDADSDGAVWEFLAAKSFKTIKKLAGGFPALLGIAIDGSGDVYFTQAGTAAVEELEAVGGAIPANPTTLTITMGSEYSYVGGVAVDKNGHLFVSDIASNSIVKLQNESVVYFGNVNVCPSAETVTAACSNTLKLSYNITAPGSLGNPIVLTTGQSNLDYTLAGGNTCAGSVQAGFTCTVDVAFAPLAPGPRNGAVKIVGANGSVIATTYIYGSGVGPAVAMSPGAPTMLSIAFSKPWGAVVDAAGDLYVSDVSAGTITEIPVGGTPLRTIASGLNVPMQLALDGAGNLYVGTDGTSSSVVEVPAGCGSSSCWKSVGSGFTAAGGVAVDGSGDVFVSDFERGIVVEVPAGCASSACQIAIAPSGISGAHALAIDAAGDLFAAQYTTGAGIIEIPAGCATASCRKSVGSGFKGTTGVAVDAAGNVFVSDYLGRQSYEVTAAGGQIALNSPYYPLGIAVDGSGNVFIAGQTKQIAGEVEELQRSLPSEILFASTPVGTTSIQSVQFQNIGNAELQGDGLSIGLNWIQAAGSGTPEDCFATLPLAPGAECNLSLSFAPTSVGAFTGAVTLENNALNAEPATQSVLLSGAGVVKSQAIAFNAIPSQVVNASLNLVATASSGLPVSFASTTPTICAASGSAAKMLKTGVCSIMATQAGSVGYAAAAPVSQSFTIAQ